MVTASEWNVEGDKNQNRERALCITVIPIIVDGEQLIEMIKA